jgi:hypothetical protein
MYTNTVFEILKIQDLNKILYLMEFIRPSEGALFFDAKSVNTSELKLYLSSLSSCIFGSYNSKNIKKIKKISALGCTVKLQKFRNTVRIIFPIISLRATIFSMKVAKFFILFLLGSEIKLLEDNKIKWRESYDSIKSCELLEGEELDKYFRTTPNGRYFELRWMNRQQII